MPQRKALLALARDRIEKWYVDRSHLDDPPKEKSGVKVSISKEDKVCGGNGVPLVFMEFDVENARPVDVFNTVFSSENESQWDTAVGEMRAIGEWKNYQARGIVGFFNVNPLPTREAHEWQVASANFTSEEFWVIFTTLENDELRQKEPVRSGAVAMQNCLAAYKITANKAGGAHVINAQQVNAHPWPLSARAVFEAGWQAQVTFVDQLRGASQKQANRDWEANRTAAPAWMLDDNTSCALERPDLSLRKNLLSKASSSLDGFSWLNPKKTRMLPDGQAMQFWWESQMCGAGATPPAEAPLIRAEFVVQGASPQEVFNVIIAKKEEVRWNPSLSHLNLTGFDRGVRGVHEEFIAPSFLGHQWKPRELFEWQAASHNASTGDYLAVLSSAEEPLAPSFGDEAVTAAQCVAGYEVSSDGAGGSRVRLAQHINADVGLLSHLVQLWEGSAESMLATWAAQLSDEAREFAASRRQTPGAGVLPNVDVDALRLLCPPPADRNASVTVGDVLLLAKARTKKHPRIAEWQRAFASLDLLQALDAGSWPARSFQNRTAEVMDLFQLLEPNATEEEVAVFAAGRSKDSLDLQMQGEALSSLQWRYLEVIARDECESPALPDINGDKSAMGLSLPVLIALAVALVLLMAACIGFCCWRGRQWRRNRRAREAASALLSSAHSSNVSLRDAASACRGSAQPADNSTLSTCASATAQQV
eukprot:TRINITY_DN37315_c0_g1_i1.p1 TRINITY_DN37315_c0_g1~~TRINITY_DN37315_c0_g1_i1.p1  ORF type:complete len:706 (+),score=149.32 TRINITY_DN37315_c0_g1_i1:106-2223(+)